MARARHPPILLRAALVLCALGTGTVHAADGSIEERTAAPTTGTVERVLIVRSGGDRLYREVGAGIAASLRESPLPGAEPPDIEQTDLTALEADEVAGARSESTVFVAVGTPAARWLAEHLPADVPLVYAFASAFEIPELGERAATAGIRAEISLADQVATIRRMMPDARELRVGMLYDSRDRASTSRRDGLRAALPPGWTLHAVDVASHDSAYRAVAALLETRVGLVWTANDRSALPKASFVLLLQETMAEGIPMFGYSHGCVRSGAAFGVGYPLSQQTATAVELVRALLVDPSARTLEPPHRHPKAELSINRLAAEGLGLSLPTPVLEMARYIFPRDAD